MKTVSGVFRSFSAAYNATEKLMNAGFQHKQITLLCPGSSEESFHAVPTTNSEQPGMGAAVGALVGGALGAAGGLELGVAISALIPGAGPVLAFGLAGAALFGAGGVAGGAALGQAAEDKTTAGFPSDEIFFYEDAVRQGRSVVLILADDDAEERRARKVLAEAGAESLDAARKDWWLGVRDVEQEHYRSLGHNFEMDEENYRTGFEAALRRECRDASPDAEADCLKWWYPKTWNSDSFQRGYARGRRYWKKRVSAPCGAGTRAC